MCGAIYSAIMSFILPITAVVTVFPMVAAIVVNSGKTTSGTGTGEGTGAIGGTGATGVTDAPRFYLLVLITNPPKLDGSCGA